MATLGAIENVNNIIKKFGSKVQFINIKDSYCKFIIDGMGIFRLSYSSGFVEELVDKYFLSSSNKAKEVESIIKGE